MTAPAVENFDLLDHLAQDPGAQASVDRDVICRAIRGAALANDGHVTAAWTREYMDADPLAVNINPNRVGAVVSGLVKRGLLVDTGRVTRSGDTRNRNGNRRLPVYSVPDAEAIK